MYPSAEGVKNFENFITDSTLYRMFIMGAYQMFVAVADGGIVGMITLRDSQHISLLFVDERYHRQGIGRALLSYLTDYMGEGQRQPVLQRVCVLQRHSGDGLHGLSGKKWHMTPIRTGIWT